MNRIKLMFQFILIVVGLVSCAATSSFKGHSKEEKVILSEVKDGVGDSIRSYLKSFEEADVKKLRQVTSYSFFHSTGGEDSWGKNLNNLKAKYKKVSFSGLEIRRPKKSLGSDRVVFVRFNILSDGKMLEAKSNTWFVLKQNKRGKWLIDSQTNFEGEP